MKFCAVFLALCAVGANGFVTGPATAFVSKPLKMSEDAAVAEAPSAKVVPDAGMRMDAVRKAIGNLDAANFASTLTSIEPYLLNVAGSTMYSKSMQRIKVQAKALKVEIPSGFAREAKATEKSRTKQDAFIQKKEDARIAAEAAAVAEAEAAAAAEVEAAAAAAAAAVEAAAAPAVEEDAVVA
jgi:hypothetical protein